MITSPVLMIGAYIITKMLAYALDEDREFIVRAFAVITIFLAALCIFGTQSAGSSIINYLNTLQSSL